MIRDTGGESQMNYIYQQVTDELTKRKRMVDKTQAHQYNYATIQLYPELQYDNNLPELCPLWFDLDCKENPDKARVEMLSLISIITTTFGLSIDTIQLYFSGNKGFHIIIDHHVLGIQPRISLHRKHKQIASILQKENNLTALDLQIYTNRRLCRNVNKKHPESGLYKIALTPAQLDDSIYRIYTLAKEVQPVIRYSNVYNEKATSYYKKLISYTPINTPQKHITLLGHPTGIKNTDNEWLFPCINHYYRVGLDSIGERHIITGALSCYLKRVEQLDEETNFHLCWEWNERFAHLSNDTPEGREANIRCQVRTIYENDYTFECQDGWLSDVLIRHCDDSCPLKMNARSLTHEVSPLKKEVYHAMVRHAQKYNRTFVFYEGKQVFSVSSIQLLKAIKKKVTKGKMNIVLKAMNELCEIGYIKKVPDEYAIHNPHGGREANCYIIC
jgi:hypothetical protein